MRCAPKDETAFFEQDLVDLLHRDQKNLASEGSRAYLEKVGPVDA
jgi:hypothetical protein